MKDNLYNQYLVDKLKEMAENGYAWVSWREYRLKIEPFTAEVPWPLPWHWGEPHLIINVRGKLKVLTQSPSHCTRSSQWRAIVTEFHKKEK